MSFTDFIDVISKLRELLAEQVLMAALGIVACGRWSENNRRAAFLVGPAGALNSVFTRSSKAQGAPKSISDKYSLEPNKLMAAYAAWFYPVSILIFKNAWVGSMFIALMVLAQLLLWRSWKHSKTQFKLNQINGPTYNFAAIGNATESTGHREGYESTSDEENVPIERKKNVLEFTNRYAVFLSSTISKLSVNCLAYPSIYPDPAKGIVYWERALRIILFFLWIMAVGVASIDDSIKNINIISVFLTTTCLQWNNNASEETYRTWANTPSFEDLSYWDGFINLKIKDLEEPRRQQPGERWVEQVLLVKFLPDHFSEKTKQDVCRGITVPKEWLADIIRKASPTKVQRCLDQYDHSEKVPITCFDYFGIIVWSILMEIENHVYNKCANGCTNSVLIPTGFSMDMMRHRAKILLLATNHQDCLDIQKLSERITALIDSSTVICRLVTHFFKLSSTLQPLEQEQDLPDGSQNAICPTFRVDNKWILLAYCYKLMSDKRLAYHFQYANTLERLSLARGAETDFSRTDKLTITHGPLEINVSRALVTLPDKQWMYIDDSNNIAFLSFEQPISVSTH
jgi:hypothetical protein